MSINPESVDGSPYVCRATNQYFYSVIIRKYKEVELTVSEILEGAIKTFSAEVRQTVRDELFGVRSIELKAPNHAPIIYQAHVAKRLVLLRKAGKLERKRPIFDKPRTGKRKKERQGANAGSLIKKVE